MAERHYIAEAHRGTDIITRCACETADAAIAHLARMCTLSLTAQRVLRNEGHLTLNARTHGADECKIIPCDCDNQMSHLKGAV
jgi:hypothetical protein